MYFFLSFFLFSFHIGTYAALGVAVDNYLYLVKVKNLSLLVLVLALSKVFNFYESILKSMKFRILQPLKTCDKRS